MSSALKFAFVKSTFWLKNTLRFAAVGQAIFAE